MKTRAASITRRVVSVVASAGLMAGIAATAVTPSANADSDRLTTWTALNIRSGPSTNDRVVGGLYPGQLVTADGPSKNGWTPIIWNGKRAWVSSQYMKVAGSGKASSPEADSTVANRAPGTKVTTAALNVRTGPSTTYRIVDVIRTGTAVKTTGAFRNGFEEISYNGQSRWVSTQYLTDSKSSSSGGAKLPATKGTKIATTALMIRTTSGSNYQSLGDVPKGTKVPVTGVVRNGMAQVIWNGAVRWMTNKYLQTTTSTGPSAPSPSLPAVKYYRYATTALMIRTTSNSSYKSLGDVATGTKLAMTGVVQNGVAQVVYGGAVRWVNANYLATSAPSSDNSNSGAGSGSGRPSTSISGIPGTGLSGLTSRSKVLLNQIHDRYPQVTWFNGVRPDAIPDHPSGRAVDSMLPNYTSAASNKLGWDIAKWAQANAGTLGIDYIIFDQRIWSVGRASEGWRLMADRGSDNANHKNHVHITVKP